ncbi:MAG: hypothetical protein E7463_01655 [Ruminococcaceae bacterium]|nr:hypothetical protein [Oscillospiraceae bacterium]
MVNTVLGPISPDALGVTLGHEHIFVGSGDFARAFGDRWYNREALIELAVTRLTEAKERFGLSTVFDGTPVDLGRDVGMLVEVSRRSGVNIVASTGLYWDDRSFMSGKKPEELARFFIDECTRGMENTYLTAQPVLPGLLKCATDHPGLTSINALSIETMGIVQRETHLPLYAHNAHRHQTAPAQLDVLERAGADLTHVIVGHTSDTQDVDYLTSLLARGVYIGFDRIYAREDQADTLCRLLDRGYGDRILLSRDGAAFLDFGDRTYASELEKNVNTFLVVLGPFCELLRARGVSQAELDRMLIENPARLFR